MADGDWFLPKRIGYGAGLPIAWQGWALVIGYVALATAGGLWLAPRHTVLFVILLSALTVPLMIVSAQHTRGGWKWRSGGED